MRWVTREHVKVGRIACSWLIHTFIDPEAEILYLPAGEIAGAVDAGAIPFHVRSPGSPFVHTAGRTPFEAMIEHYDLTAREPALALLGRIVNGADTDNRTYGQPEAPGLRAITDGLQLLDLGDDTVVCDRGAHLFDALLAYCRKTWAQKRSDSVLSCHREG